MLKEYKIKNHFKLSCQYLKNRLEIFISIILELLNFLCIFEKIFLYHFYLAKILLIVSLLYLIPAFIVRYQHYR
jgi:hypothetical protein